MGDLDKLIGAKGFKKLPKVQKITQSGHTGHDPGSITAVEEILGQKRYRAVVVAQWAARSLPISEAELESR